MSDVKPEEPVKPAETKLVEPEATPAITDTVPTAPITVAEEPPKAEEVVEDKKEEKHEPKEITQGALQKSHGGLLSFFKKKRFFYFHEEAISESDLKTYHHKDNSSKATCAYALQTGKGLWFYSKDEGHKHPHGIIKLSDVTEVTESGSNKFVLKLSTGDLHFEAPPAERDSWVFTLKTKIAEAKATAEEVHESEGYKAALEKLSKPVPFLKPAAPKEEHKETTEEARPATEEGKTDAAVPEAAVTSDEEAAEHKTDMKRSQSKKNKRISGFNVPFLNKKEKAEEKKAEEKKEEVAAEETARPDTAEVSAAPGVDSPVAEAAAETKPAEEEAKPEEPRPEVKKSFFSRFSVPKKEASTEKGKEVEAVTPAAETESAADKVPETAPVIDIPAAAEEKKDDRKTPTSPKSEILSFFHKRDKSPVPKAPVEEKIEDKVDAVVAAAEPATETPKEVAPAAATEETAVESPKDAVAPSPKEKRKSSFFGFGAKEKKAEDVKSDSEDAEPTATKPSTSPVPKSFIAGLKRKVSKAGKGERETKEVAAPAAVAEEETPKDAAPETAEPVATVAAETKPEETPAEVAPAVSDVTAAKPVQAAA